MDKRALRSLAGGIALGALSLCFLEAGARLFYHPSHSASGDWLFEYDPQKLYRWKANADGIFGTEKIHINSEHRVGNLAGPPKSENTQRVVVLGDSVSFGFNLPYAESYVPLLEKEIPGTEWVNYSVPGYSTFQEYFDLESSLPLCPDLVLLQFQANDLVEPFHVLKRLGGVGIDYHRVPDPSGVHFFLRGWLRTYEFISDFFLSAAASYGKQETLRLLEKSQAINAREVLGNPGSERSLAARAEFFPWLEKMGKLCREQNLSCVFFPSPSSFQFHSPSKEITASMDEIKMRARTAGFTDILDPWPAVAAALAAERKNHGASDPMTLWNKLFLDDIHPNARGHALYRSFLGPALHAILQKKPPRKCGS